MATLRKNQRHLSELNRSSVSVLAGLKEVWLTGAMIYRDTGPD